MALPFNLANLEARAPANKVVDQNLIEAERTFGIPDFVMAEDMVNYYKDAPPNLNREPIEDPLLPPVSGIYNPNLLPLNFNNDNDRNNLNNINMGLGSPDLELENMYEDEGRFDDTLDKKKGIMEILGMLPTPLNIARKGIDFFNDYRKEKEEEIEAEKIIEQMRQERIKNEEIAKQKAKADAIKIEIANRNAAREAGIKAAARKSAIAQEAANRDAAREAGIKAAARKSAIAQEAADRDAAREAGRKAAAQRQKALQRSRGPIGRGDGDGGGGRSDSGAGDRAGNSGGTGGRRGGGGRYR